MAIDTVVSGDSVVVVGPPASLTVNVDIGPEGNRGALFFTGYGPPNTSELSNPQVGDLYINRELGASYGVVYKYSAVAGDGAESWLPILKFQPNTYSNFFNVPFSLGVGSVSLPLSDFYGSAPEDLDVSTVLVQATAEADYPVFISVSNKTISDISTVKTFTAELQAAQLTSGSASLISGSIQVNILLTSGVVD